VNSLTLLPPFPGPDNVTAAQKYLGMTGLEVKKIAKLNEERYVQLACYHHLHRICLRCCHVSSCWNDNYNFLFLFPPAVMAVRAVMMTRGHKLYSQQSFIGSVVMIFTYS
jgi:hypothetical protein